MRNPRVTRICCWVRSMDVRHVVAAADRRARTPAARTLRWLASTMRRWQGQIEAARMGRELDEVSR